MESQGEGGLTYCRKSASTLILDYAQVVAKYYVVELLLGGIGAAGKGAATSRTDSFDLVFGKVSRRDRDVSLLPEA